MSGTHWHDTPEFASLVEKRIEQMRSDETDATNHCRHFILMTRDGKQKLERDAPTYFMHGRNGRTWLMCEACCRSNVELELLTPAPDSAVN